MHSLRPSRYLKVRSTEKKVDEMKLTVYNNIQCSAEISAITLQSDAWNIRRGEVGKHVKRDSERE